MMMFSFMADNETKNFLEILHAHVGIITGILVRKILPQGKNIKILET